MATYLADRVIVFEGIPAISATATPYGSFFFVLETLIAIVSPQTTITPHGDEQVSSVARNNFPSRPDELPAACEQTLFSQGQGAKKFVFLTFCDRHLMAFCSASGNYFFLEE